MPGELWAGRGQGRAAGAGRWQGPTSASSKGRTQAGVRGTLSPPAAGRERESERRETQLGTLLPSLRLRQTPRVLRNDEGIKPLFYLILWLRI